MGPKGKDAGYGGLQAASIQASGGPGGERTSHGHGRDSELVFDFTGLHRPGLCDLALILTARLQAEPGERVWVRALPESTWTVLQALGLDHLFHLMPGPGKVRN